MKHRHTDPKPWTEVTLTHRETGERVTVIVTGASPHVIYGNCIRHTDSRVVFPRSEWSQS